MNKPGLAFLQNVWVKNPERVKQILARHDASFRRPFITKLLFYKSLTGQRLLDAFGADVDRIAWDECSPEIGGHSGSVFKPDPRHIARVMQECQPKIILVFGAVAASAVFREIVDQMPGASTMQVKFISGPHPAARTGDVLPRLRAMAAEFRREVG